MLKVKEQLGCRRRSSTGAWTSATSQRLNKLKVKLVKLLNLMRRSLQIQAGKLEVFSLGYLVLLLRMLLLLLLLLLLLRIRIFLEWGLLLLLRL